MDPKNKSLLSRLFTKKKVESKEPAEAVDPASIKTNSQFLPHTVLSLTAEQEQQFTDAQKEAYRQQLLKLPPLRVGDIDIVPFEAGTYMGGYYVRVFIRNGSDVEDEVSLDRIPLFLLDAQGEKVAGGAFTLNNFAPIKFGESRLWSFAWRKEQVLKQDADLSSYSVTLS